MKNSKKKQVYKSDTKNTKVYITIAILILLLLQIIAFGLSRAQRLIEIVVTIKDSENLVESRQIILNAFDSGDSGSFILLPEKIDNIYITEYQIEKLEDDLEDEDEMENDLDYDVRSAGDKVFLTEAELDSKELELIVLYNSKESELALSDTRLYYQDLYENNYIENEEVLENLLIKGFMPLDIEFEIDTEVPLEVRSLLNDTIDESEDIDKVIKLDFLLNDDDYDLSSLTENLQLKVFPINTDKVYSVYSVNKKSEYIGKTDVKDALGNPINTFNITEIKEIYADLEALNINITEIEYLAIISRDNAYKSMMMPMGAGGIMPMGMEIPEGFDPSTSTDIWDGSVSTDFIGNGQANNPYLITSGADLAYLRNRVNANVNYENQYFQLTNNIDLDGREWEPIGNYNRPFRGNLDGGGRTIKNAVITASGTMPTNTNGNVVSFGFFGSIGGGTNANNRQIIQNLELDNIEIASKFSGNTTNSTTDRMFGINLGTLTGTMFQNSTISNVNVRNLDINHTGSTMSIRSYRFQYLIGGLVGEAIRLPATIGDPSSNLRYSIVNCVVDGDISMNSATARNMASGGQFATGGIIGRIRSQPVWPENCIYRGDIYSSTSFIGPIFAQLRHNTNVNRTGDFPTLWNGNDAGNLTCTSSYNTFRAYNTSFTNTVISGNSTARRSTSSNDIGYVQGVNKGIYQNNNNTLVNSLNAATASNNVKWQYSNQNGYTLRPRLRANVNESPENTYNIQVDDSYYSATPYTYQWIVNGVVSNTSTVYVHTELNFDVDLDIVVRVRDTNGYISIYKFIIPRLYVEISFNINYNQDSAEAILSGSGWYLTGYSDYSFQWYKEDISGYEETEIVGATSRFITGLDTAYDYKLIAINNVIPQLSCENSFEYAERTVIYVRSNGNNNNDGLTPTTPVQTFATAFSRLPTNGTRETNVIVVMGSITDNQIFTGETATTYRRDVTITGVYKKDDYNATIVIHGASVYKYMNGDTTFMYLTLDGSNNQLYWFLQGFSFTIGEQVSMIRYPTANTNQGLITGNAPGFHIFASWCRYNYANLPRNNPDILIKSGTYGRIILGGSPGTNNVNNLNMTTSNNFIGSPTNMFTPTVTIDIVNSTTPSNYAYDINLLVGGSAAGNNYSHVVQNIISGRVGRVLGGAIGDSSVRPNRWNYPINTFMGSATINISGGEIVELYGGSLGRNMSALTNSSTILCDSYFYGVVEINITGGQITGDIYGAGAGRSIRLSSKFF